MQEPEYAPQYSMRERWRFAAICIACYAALWVIFEWWASPQLRMFSQTAHCRTVLGISGSTVLMYGMFVGLPLMAAVSVGAFLIPNAVRSIRTRQHPPPGQKVLRRVKILSGRGAVVRASVELGLVAALVAIAAWGGFMAGKFTQSIERRGHLQQCHAGHRAAIPATKGYELYSWQVADGTWRYSLLPGTNRMKATDEVTAAAVVISDASALKRRLAALATNDQVFWHLPDAVKFSLPDPRVLEDLKAYCKELQIDLQVMQ
jgi:hypothetical protein